MGLYIYFISRKNNCYDSLSIKNGKSGDDYTKDQGI